MADHFYCRDRIRCNLFIDSTDPLGIIGWFGVAAACDACRVVREI